MEGGFATVVIPTNLKDIIAQNAAYPERTNMLHEDKKFDVFRELPHIGDKLHLLEKDFISLFGEDKTLSTIQREIRFMYFVMGVITAVNVESAVNNG